MQLFKWMYKYEKISKIQCLFIWKKKHINICKYIEYLWKGTKKFLWIALASGEKEMGVWESEWRERLTLHCICFDTSWILRHVHVSANSPGRADLKDLAQVTCLWSSQTKAMQLHLHPLKEAGPQKNIQRLLEKEEQTLDEQKQLFPSTRKSLILICQAQTQAEKRLQRNIPFIIFCY